MKNMDNNVEAYLRVNHAGETAAIQIYKMQIVVSKWFKLPSLGVLEDFMVHEKAHQKIFFDELKKRNMRTCYALPVWKFLGGMLGFVTALMGQEAIWICTYSVEKVVANHLKEQKLSLENIDPDFIEIIDQISKDELMHQEYAESHSRRNTLLGKFIEITTKIAIYVSTKL